MAYLDTYIEECPAFGWQGGGEFKTTVVEMASGAERRNAEWQNVRHRYQMSFLNITKAAYRNIKQLHLVCRGRLHCFKFRDQLDFEADNEAFGVGTGSRTEWQLIKQSLIDGVSYQREVYVIEPGAVVRVNGTPTAVTIDQDRGIVTFGVAPANGAALTWSGTFAVWVRFDQDYMPFSLDNPDATNGSVDLIEMPPPEPSS